jgi:hypothetical protein
VFVFYLNLCLVSTSTFDKHQLVLPVIRITQQCDVVSCLEDPKELQLIFFAGLKCDSRQLFPVLINPISLTFFLLGEGIVLPCWLLLW